MMKRILLGATLTLAAAPAFAEDWDFILVNDTGKSIKGIEIAEGGSGKWVANKVDPDRKREGVTGPGKRMTVHGGVARGRCLRQRLCDGKLRQRHADFQGELIGARAERWLDGRVTGMSSTASSVASARGAAT